MLFFGGTSPAASVISNSAWVITSVWRNQDPYVLIGSYRASLVLRERRKGWHQSDQSAEAQRRTTHEESIEEFHLRRDWSGSY